MYTFLTLALNGRINFSVQNAHMTKPVIPWAAHALQVALFSNTVFPIGENYFSALLGVEPDTSEDRPREGVRTQVGAVDGAHVQIGITPLRLDVVFSPPPQAASLDVEGIRTSIGPFVPELRKFSNLILKWVEGIDTPLVRVAFIGAAIADAASREEAYDLLANSVKSLAVSPEMTDLVYRVNWRATTSTLTEGFFNRLTTWTAQKLDLSAGFNPQSVVKVGTRNFAKLDIDINTPAERRDPLPRADIPKLLSEIFELAVDIAEHGEPA
ncbi:hypothetical protein [Bradyrhizobium sp. B120]|uniref:hypothetical protein n=1 Tax=Bradyrhizobium sp. B120 TaxID=3410088 RepID=UPI003B97EF91